MGGPANDWPEGPSLVESIRRYKWLVVSAMLIGATAAFIWSSQQPVRYEGVVRLFLDTGRDAAADPGRVVRSQAEYLLSPTVLNEVVARTDGRLTRKELEKRLAVEPAKNADLITIRVLGATPREAAALANSVASSYRKVLAEQANDNARQAVADLARRQRQLEGEIAALNEQLRANPENPRLEANRDAKIRQLNDLADQTEDVRRDTARAGRAAERAQEEAAIPDEPAQPKPLRTAAIGALLALLIAAGVAWWWNGRQMAFEQYVLSRNAPGGIGGRQEAERNRSSPLRLGTHMVKGSPASTNGASKGNGSMSGIVDFDQIATSAQELFRFLDGPSQRLYEEDLPQLAAEEIAARYRVDLAAILLDNAGEVQMMGNVGLRPSRTGTIDRGVRHLIETATHSGPRLVHDDELVRLSSTVLGGDQVDSLAVVPLIRDQIGFGVLVAGRRHTDEQVSPLSHHEVQEIADSMRDMVPYLWAWLLLRGLKQRLRTLQ